MAHIAKYKAASVGHMLAHYRRDRGAEGRDNIDPNRTKDNLTLAVEARKPERGTDATLSRAVWRVVERDVRPNWETVRERIERVDDAAKAAGKRKTRKDAVVMADLVVTLPENVPPEDEDKFFKLTFMYLAKQVGADNVLGGFIHKDEVYTAGALAGKACRDHMHVPWTPIFEGRFNFKGQCPRWFYAQLHEGLGDFLQERMGYRPEVELGEEKKAQKLVSKVGHDKVAEAQRAIVEPSSRQAEKVLADARETAAVVLDDAADRADAIVNEAQVERDALLDEVRELKARKESLRQETDALGDVVERLEAVVKQTAVCEGASRSGRSGALHELAALCDAARGSVERLRAVLSRFARSLRPNPPLAVQAASVAAVEPERGYDFGSEFEDCEDWAREVYIEPPEPERGTYHSWGHGL